MVVMRRHRRHRGRAHHTAMEHVVLQQLVGVDNRPTDLHAALRVLKLPLVVARTEVARRSYSATLQT